MSIERGEQVLVLSGPQHRDERRPVIGALRRYAEHLYPLGIGIVSAHLKNVGLEPIYREMRPGRIDELGPLIKNAKGVFISARTYDTDMALEVSRMAERCKKPVVIGGYGPSLTPEIFGGIPKVIGEFEPIANVVIDDFMSSRLKGVYDARKLPPHDIYNNYVWPDRSIFGSTRRGLTRVPQEWERGCSNYCPFCSPVVFQGGGRPEKVRERNVDDIKNEIESMKIDSGHLFLTDLNTARMTREALLELLPFLKERRIKFYTEGTTKPLLDDLEANGPDGSLLKLMSPLYGNGGCYSFLYGADDLVVEKVAGSRDKETSQIAETARVFRGFGIPLNLSVVVGLDEHTFPESFFVIRKLLEEVKVAYTFMHVATPYRGTAWGNSVEKRGDFIVNTKSTDFNHRRVVHNPKNMKVEELQQGYYWLLKSMASLRNSFGSIANNFDTKLFQKDPLLGFFATGIFWDFETNLTVKELQVRGYVDSNKQRMLDWKYQEWLKKN